MSEQENLIDLSNIKQLQVDLNERMFKLIKKSVLFADDQFMEWFTLTVGVEALIGQAGAVNVKKFDSFQVINI
jgi:hypothetical protein